MDADRMLGMNRVLISTLNRITNNVISWIIHYKFSEGESWNSNNLSVVSIIVVKIYKKYLVAESDVPTNICTLLDTAAEVLLIYDMFSSLKTTGRKERRRKEVTRRVHHFCVFSDPGSFEHD